MQTQRQEQRAREKDFKEQSSLLRFLEEKKGFLLLLASQGKNIYINSLM